MKTTVIHHWNKAVPLARKEGRYVYIGRPSKWGNPYVIGKDGDRKTTIDKYREYLLKRPDLLADAKTELRGKVLGCWCYPLPCHGDVIVEMIDEGGSAQCH